MRGNDNKNASRLKSYGRFLNGFYARLMNGHFIENRENGAGIKKAEIGAERQLSLTICFSAPGCNGARGARPSRKLLL